VVLNRSALAPGRLWDAAIIHETWHCFQAVGRRNTLWGRALHEGVVTHLTQVVDPTLDDATVMLWSQDEWDAGIKHKDAIVANRVPVRSPPTKPAGRDLYNSTGPLQICRCHRSPRLLLAPRFSCEVAGVAEIQGTRSNPIACVH
jgi:hypothetical protein